MSDTFQLDGEDIPFAPGQTVLQAALSAGHYIPHLCYHPEFKPHGSCKVCTVKIGNRTAASCTLPAQAGQEIESNTEEMNALRRTLVQMLFAEGNHFCPSCEKSGNCELQALGSDLGVMPHTPTSCSISTVASCANCASAPPAKSMKNASSPSPAEALPSIWWSTRRPASWPIPTLR
jgi:predicted molibdopterin-dependent oxidoreductase YjgC